MEQNESRKSLTTFALTYGIPLTLLVGSAALVCFQVERVGPLIRVGTPWFEVLMLAIAMTPIIIMGGIDLSVGGTIALSVVTMGLSFKAGYPIEACVFGTLLVAGSCGLANGCLIICGIAPLVATLATMALFQGLALTLMEGERVRGFPEAFTAWREVGPLPIQYWLALLIFLVGYTLMHRTRWGSWAFAIGSNPTAARYTGIPASRITLAAYLLSGLVAGIIAVFYTMTHDAAIANPHRNIELRVIASVIVGGTLITGGAGSVDRTLMGWAIVALLDVGLEFLGNRVESITAETRLIVTGVLLISLAVWNQRIRQ